jgi:2'-5' RNA ligase
MSRFFFALWPDNATRAAIFNCHSQFTLSGQITDQSNLHITLLFLGKLNVDQQQTIIKEAEKIICSRFEICLSHTGYFEKSKVVWLGLKSTPDVLLELHEKLLSIAEKHLNLSPQQTYKPHVTLIRKCFSIGTQQILPITWHIKDFVLVESIDTDKGVKYQIIKRFA